MISIAYELIVLKDSAIITTAGTLNSQYNQIFISATVLFLVLLLQRNKSLESCFHWVLSNKIERNVFKNLRNS